MDDETAALAAAIGSRVRQERQTRQWTLEQLAQAAELSRRMVINVEQGVVNPSVGTLLRLSGALGVGLPALVEPAQPVGVQVTRNGSGATLWHGEAGGRGVLVASTQSPDVLELWHWTLLDGEGHHSQAHSPGTKELLQVLEGSIVLEVAGEAVTLTEGDAATLPGDAPHAYLHTGNTPARFALAVFEPGLGPAGKNGTSSHE